MEDLLSVDENKRDVHVADKVIGLKRFRSDLDARHHHITILARLGFGLDIGEKEFDVLVDWNVETSVPLAIDMVEWYEGAGHGCWLEVEC